MNSRDTRLDGVPSGAGWWAVLAFALGVAAAWPRLDAKPAVVLLDALVAALLVTAGGAVSGLVPHPAAPRRALRAAGVLCAVGGLAAWPAPAAQAAAVIAVGTQSGLQARGLLNSLGSGRGGKWALVLPVVVGVGWIATGFTRLAGLAPAVFAFAGLVAVAAAAVWAVAVLTWHREIRPAWRALPALAAATSSAAVLSVALLAMTGVARSAGVSDVIVALMTASAPGAVLLTALRHRQLRAEVAQALVRVAHPLTAEAVREVVAELLRDPGASLHYSPVSDRNHEAPAFVRIGPPPDGKKRIRVDVLAEGGSTLAFVEGDPAGRRQVFDVLAVACAPAVQNARLREAEITRLDEVITSRSRIVAAALQERRRLERDLHDGAQQRLLAVSARLGLARSTADTPRSLAAIDAARDQLRETLGELRALAREVHPAVLEAAGIGAALEMSAGRLGVTVEVNPPQERYPTYAETAAYLTVHELLADAVPAGGLTHARVDLNRNGPLLQVSLRHNGPARSDTPAVQHATDRLRALGGNLHAGGAAGAVQILAEVPCE